MGSKTSVSQKSSIPKEFSGSVEALLGGALSAGAAATGNQIPADFDFEKFFKKGDLQGLDPSIFVSKPYEGDFVAAPDPLQLQSLQQRADLGQQLQGFADPYYNLVQDQIAGKYLNAEQNPYLQGTIKAAIDPVRQQFTEQIIPGFESQAINQGAYQGSSRRDLVENQLSNQFDQNAMNLAGQIAYANYASERQIQQQGATQLDQAARLKQLPSVLLGEAGAGFQQLAQQELDNAFRQYTEQIIAPFRVLDPLGNLIQGTQGIPLNQVQSQNSSQLSNGITGALGGAGTGTALNEAIFGAGAGYPQSAAVLGGLLGGIAGTI